MLQNIGAIARKELRIYFTTATSYALMTAFALITAFFFLQLVIFYQLQASQLVQDPQTLARLNFNEHIIAPLFGNVQIFFLFLIPMITMRLLAEEQRTKTMQLLMTSPIRPIEIVLGKYCAAAALVLTMLATTLVFPLILNHYGAAEPGKSPLDWGTIGTQYLGIFLMGAAFVAIGLLASSLTDSQIVAVVISFAALLMFWVIGAAGMGKTGFWHEFTNYLSIMGHQEGFVRGVIRIQDVVYYLSLIGLGLFLTHRMVEAQRWR